jgi:hypothetical protein
VLQRLRNGSAASWARRYAASAVDAARDVVARADPAERERRRLLATQRAQIDTQLAALADAAPRRPQRLLIDGQWDNPHYWYRLGLLRTALGSAGGPEFGFTGEWQARPVRETFSRLGIDASRSYVPAADARAHMKRAAEIVARLRSPDDLLSLELPLGMPTAIVYDGILKRIRQAEIDPRHPALPALLAEALAAIAAADALLAETRPELLVLSHAIGFTYGALAWCAVRRGIPAIVLYGNYGVPRFFRLGSLDDIYDWNNGLDAAEIDTLPEDRSEALAAAGRAYLGRRLSGATDDLGGRSAFAAAQVRSDRAMIAGAFGWDPDKPIVSVYASNWFDFPHGCGLSQFRDLKDWLAATLDAAAAHPDVNWLFKPHPCDAWYGGITLADLMPPARPSHLALAPADWNGAAVTTASDALVTLHSTGGIEYAASGKPVLLADRGWYDRAGFARRAGSRAEYAQLLQSRWWDGMDMARARHHAEVFAGAYFCAPAWQDPIVTADDSERGALYAPLGRILDRRAEIEREIALLREWMAGGTPRYHGYKMLRDEPVGLGNARPVAA